ncbi:MAG: magnesium transporter [Pseudomonadota bacterium]|nr:magnesium transporter [Pseudomonadota bacterium]
MTPLEHAIEKQDLQLIRSLLVNWTPPTIADALRNMTAVRQAVVLRVLPRKEAATVFEFLDRAMQTRLLKAMAQQEVADILNFMAPDDRTSLLEESPAAFTKNMLAVLTPDERNVAVCLLGYPKGSIGRLMTPQYVAVKQDWSVKAVLDYVREHGTDSETLSVLYVIDDAGVLIDDIRVREFLLAPPERLVSEIMDHRFVTLSANDEAQTAINVFLSEDRKALPVVDSTGVLIGIVTIDDVLKVAESRATAELQRVGGTEALDEPYLATGFWRMIKKRGGWLVMLFLGEMLTATAMSFFEGEIQKAVVLALFVPLIISSGGNSGSQATTLIIRALAIGEVKLRDWWNVMRREILSGLVLGAILGTIGFFRIAAWSMFSTIYGPHWLLVGCTVGVSLIGIVMWGSLAGSMLPFLLRRVGFDPATASAPFVATLVDVTGLVIYFSVAYVFLKGTLL